MTLGPVTSASVVATTAVVPVSAGSVELDVPGSGRLVVEATA